MGFYNPLIPIINIIKKFLYFISKKIFILLLIIIFLAFFIILSFISKSMAISDTNPYYSVLENQPLLKKAIENATSSNKWPYGNYVVFGYDSQQTGFRVVCGDKDKVTFFFDNDVLCARSTSPSTIDNYWYYGDGNYAYKTTNGIGSGQTITGLGAQYEYSYSDIVVYNSNNEIVYPYGFDSNVIPYIYNSTLSIEDWSFDNFIIKGNIDIRHNNDFFKTLILKLVVNDYTYSQYIDTSYISYLDDNISNGNFWTIVIPKNQLFIDLFNSEANLLNRNFILNIVDNSENEDIDYDLGTYNITLTQQQLNDINGQNNFNQQQQLQQDITNPNISSDFNNSSGGGFRDFSDGMEIQDNTSINSMFNMIYNAFTTQYGWNGSGQAPYELELTLPISNQTIKISPYSIYGRDWYTNSDNTAITIIKTLLNMFWWYVIGSFVIKDIRNTINKVAEGNIENASSDIKKELL